MIILADAVNLDDAGFVYAGPPQVVIEVQTDRFYVGSRFSLYCRLVLPGHPPVSGVMWYKDGAPLGTMNPYTYVSS